MAKLLSLFAAFLWLAGTAIAQDSDYLIYPTPDRISGSEVEARPSPMSSTYIKSDEAYVRIIYNQPHLRGRQMLGDQVPYGKIWRLGANESTEIFTTDDIRIGGMKLNDGAYTLLAIPEAEQWTLVASKQLGQWGAYRYDESMDVWRVATPTQKADKIYEAFTIWFGPDGETLNMAWGDTMVSYDIEVDD
jgi:hypothetical protein